MNIRSHDSARTPATSETAASSGQVTRDKKDGIEEDGLDHVSRKQGIYSTSMNQKATEEDELQRLILEAMNERVVPRRRSRSENHASEESPATLRKNCPQTIDDSLASSTTSIATSASGFSTSANLVQRVASYASRPRVTMMTGPTVSALSTDQRTVDHSTSDRHGTTEGPAWQRSIEGAVKVLDTEPSPVNRFHFEAPGRDAPTYAPRFMLSFDHYFFSFSTKILLKIFQILFITMFVIADKLRPV